MPRGKKILVIGVLAVLLLVIISAVLLKPKNLPLSPKTDNPSPSATFIPGDIQTSPQTGQFRNFLSFTVPQKCTFSSTDSGSEFSGMVFLNNGKIRADMSVPASGSSVISHMLVEKPYSYIWLEGSVQGIVIEFENQTQTQIRQDGTVDPNLIVNYLCQPWTVDDTLLSRPEKMKFINLTNLILPTTLPSGNTQTCAACNDLADDQAKNVCLVRLKCGEVKRR